MIREYSYEDCEIYLHEEPMVTNYKESMIEHELYFELLDATLWTLISLN